MVDQARLDFLQEENLDEHYRTGYGTDAVGGIAGTVIHVTSLAGAATTVGTWAWALAVIAATPSGTGNVYVIIDADGILNRTSVSLINRPNITIDALGRYVIFTGRGLQFGSNADNIVLLNLMVDSISSGDGISLEQSNTPYFLAHIESSPLGGTVADGHIDIVNQSAAGQFGTVAWFRSNTHAGSELVMLQGDQNSVNENVNFLTIHHSFHDETRLRHPLVTGKAHSYNNYIRWGTFAGIEVRAVEAAAITEPPEVHSENDTFDAEVASTAGTPPTNTRGLYYYSSTSRGKATGKRLLNTAQANDQNAGSVRDFHAAYVSLFGAGADFTAHTASADHDLVIQRRAGATLRVTLSGSIHNVPADEVVGETAILDFTSFDDLPAAGASFDAVRQDIIDGFRMEGDPAFDPTTLFTSVTDIVRTSTNRATCTASGALSLAEAGRLYWEGDVTLTNRWLVGWNPLTILEDAGTPPPETPGAVVTVTSPADTATVEQLDFDITWTLEAAP